MCRACALVVRYSKNLEYLCKQLPFWGSVLGKREHAGIERPLASSRKRGKPTETPHPGLGRKRVHREKIVV